MAINTGNHPKALWPGVHSWFGATYTQHPDFIPKMFDVRSSKQNYEELVQHTGFGLAPVKPEGQAVVYDSHAQGYVARGRNVAYALGYIVSREELADNLYEKVSMSRSASLANSMAQTRQHLAANVYNRAFSPSYVGGDAVALCSTAHPSVSGDQSNKLATDADFSEASLEDLTIQMMNATDPKGLKISLTPKCLIGPNALVYEFERVLKSDLRVSTANNDINAMRHLGVIPEAIVNPYLTDSDAWFIRARGVQDGLIWFNREPVEFTKDSDFDTDNAKCKSYFRSVPFWGDYRDIWGTSGA